MIRIISQVKIRMIVYPSARLSVRASYNLGETSDIAMELSTHGAWHDKKLCMGRNRTNVTPINCR